MQRYKYDWKPETTTFGRVFDVTPVTRIAVTPGEAIEGDINVSFRSDTLLKPIMHSSILMFGLYYCPNRLADENFVDMVTGGSSAISTTTVDAQRFFERGSGTPKNELYRKAYFEIINEYFRDPDDAVVPVGTEPYYTNRIANFRTTARDSAADSATVDTSGATVTAREIRRAHAQDKWNSRREAFGNRYSDYMRTIGSPLNWAMLETPEELVVKRRRLANDVVLDTSSTTTGSPSSNMVSTMKVNVPRKTFDEHGYVVGVLAWVPRVVDRTMNPPDAYDKTADDFWSPEYEQEGMVTYPNSIWVPANPNEDNFFHPKFQHHRQADDLYLTPGSTPAEEWTISVSSVTLTPEAHRRIDPTLFNAYFRNTIGSNYHYAVNAYHNLRRFSQVRPLPAGV